MHKPHVIVLPGVAKGAMPNMAGTKKAATTRCLSLLGVSSIHSRDWIMSRAAQSP